MIKRIQIENYKSIRKLELDLGRMNVFIGENGCGKTNILEAIALGSAAAQDKLSNEFLAPRGIRVTTPQFMRSAFEAMSGAGIALTFEPAAGRSATFHLRFYDTEGGTSWTNENPRGFANEELQAFATRLRLSDPDGKDVAIPLDLAGWLVGSLARTASPPGPELSELMGPGPAAAIPDFLLYAPENTILRRFEDEGQILPLGVKGEGLLAHLQALASRPGAPVIAAINEHLQLLDWFETVEIPGKDAAGRAIRIRDRYLPEGVVFDQRSANEGFLFLLFYFTLFASPHTPKFFAIDNVDASLNPKMCAALMASMVKLAKTHDKQAIVTTHNPSLLDGLDLADDEQRLFVVSRRDDGSTRVRRVAPPKPLDGDAPVRLSDAFLRGYIGGLPKNF